MNINIKYTNLDSTPAIETYINEKIGALAKFLQPFEVHNQINARVEVGRTTNHHNKGQVYRAEVNLDLPGEVLRAEHEDWDMRITVDQAKDKLQREIVKYKERLNKKNPPSVA